MNSVCGVILVKSSSLFFKAHVLPPQTRRLASSCFWFANQPTLCDVGQNARYGLACVDLPICDFHWLWILKGGFEDDIVAMASVSRLV